MLRAMAASYSVRTAHSVFRYPSSVPSTVRSIGFRREHWEGRNSCSLLFSSGLGSETSNPDASAASAAITPGPPELVTMAIRFPSILGTKVNALPRSNISSTLNTRSAPHWRSDASKIASAPPRAPVWDCAARCPDRVRPDFKTINGFDREQARAASINSWPTDMLSM